MTTDPPRLLLVESDREVLHVAPPFMQRVGEVFTVTTPTQALGELQAGGADILVIGNRLLDADGLALLQVFRSKDACAQIMVLCDQHTAEVSASALAEGIDDTLVKPFDVAMLPARLLRLLEVMHERRRRVEQQHDLETRMRHHDRIALLGTLVATVAHEVANPLSVVSTNAALIADIARTDPSILPDDRQCLAFATHDTLEATKVIKEYLSRILEFSRRDNHRSWDEDLADTLQTAMLFARSHARDHGVHVHVDLLDKLPTVSHHATAFAQAVVNALTNAIDATTRGGHVWLRVEDGVDELAVVIEDDGPGLTPEQQAHLCEAFYTTKKTGTGLGTVVIRQVTHEHGGRVTWQNLDDGRGVSVRIVLPKRPSSIPLKERFLAK